jgi:dienelactone hydrolase
MTPIAFRNGSETLTALEAASARSKAGGARSPAVLLLPAIAGVNQYMAGVAQRPAARGCCVMLPDCYCRSSIGICAASARRNSWFTERSDA